MICLDTTFLVQLWRHREDAGHPAHQLLCANPSETFVVPVVAAGEFLEGAAVVSEARLRDAVRFLTLFELGAASLETARHYARIAADLRGRNLLTGTSRADVWIAAWCVENGAPLATRNLEHFSQVRGLVVKPY